VRGAARVTGISVGGAAGLTRKVKRKLSGFDFACVCVLCQFRHAEMVVVPGLILHVGEDAAGILAKNRIECDQWLKDGAPFELIEPTHTVENCGEWRLLDWGQIARFEGLFGSIEYVLELR
jgi:hypothetical protein